MPLIFSESLWEKTCLHDVFSILFVSSNPGLISSIALHRPVLSPDGNFIAVVVPQLEIHIISLAEVCSGSRVVKRMILPKSTQSFLSQAHTLRWSPETMVLSDNAHPNTTSELFTTWLMLSDGNRVIALSTELSNYRHAIDHDGDSEDPLSSVLADFELGNQFGKITFLDFVFSHRHALLLFEMGSQASILVSTIRFVCSLGSRCQSILVGRRTHLMILSLS